MLFLTGANDVHAPPLHTQQLAERHPGSHQVWIVPDAGHKDVCATGGLPYQRRILDFFEDALG
jgi:pimeloyl-ACP methyl ester carboxylesterase